MEVIIAVSCKSTAIPYKVNNFLVLPMCYRNRNARVYEKEFSQE